MRDRETDLDSLAEEGDELLPMRLRYGVTAAEATRHEPLDVSLDQEEPELVIADDGVWDDTEPGVAAVESTRESGLPDDLGVPQVAQAAETAAMHGIELLVQ